MRGHARLLEQYEARVQDLLEQIKLAQDKVDKVEKNVRYEAAARIRAENELKHVQIENQRLQARPEISLFCDLHCQVWLKRCQYITSKAGKDRRKSRMCSTVRSGSQG